METKYDFPVMLAPVTAHDKVIPHKQAVIRTDVWEALGIVSDQYELLKHADVVNSFREALRDTEHEERIQVTRGGANLFATYKLPSHTVEVAKGDMVALQFVVKNSYDGSNSLQIMLGALRLVCTNGMVIGKQFFSYTQRHIGSGNELKIEVIREKVDMLADQFTKTLPYLQEMSQKQVYPKFKVDSLFDQENVHLPQYLLEEAKTDYVEINGITAWDYYNSLTSAITHGLKKESPMATINYGKVAWEAAQRV